MRAALYARVSTDAQTTANQLADLHRLAAARGWEAAVYQDEGVSGAKMSRPALDRMLTDARAGKVGAVVVWALDRLGRSMQGVVALVLELDRLGVQVVSVRESWLDTAGPVRQLLLAIFGWVAEQERARLIERTRAGLDRARRQGVPLGRPRKSPAAVAAALARVGEGVALAVAARAAGVSPRTVRRALALEAGKNPPP